MLGSMGVLGGGMGLFIIHLDGGKERMGGYWVKLAARRARVAD